MTRMYLRCLSVEQQKTHKAASPPFCSLCDLAQPLGDLWCACIYPIEPDQIRPHVHSAEATADEHFPRGIAGDCGWGSATNRTGAK